MRRRRDALRERGETRRRRRASTAALARRRRARRPRSRDVARPLLRDLRASGVDVVMLSGDNAGDSRTQSRASVGIADWRGGRRAGRARPSGSVRCRRAGRTSSAWSATASTTRRRWRAADVSFAIGAGSAVAVEAADITVIRNDLNAVVDAILLSRATRAQDPAEPRFSRSPTTCSAFRWPRSAC